MKPTSTGSEMKLATKPRRNKPAIVRIAPTNKASVADATSNSMGVPNGLARAITDPASMASVVVVLTLRGRDVPSTA
ncbi:hypothetical protein D3C76_1355940 [compost metagenome]